MPACAKCGALLEGSGLCPRCSFPDGTKFNRRNWLIVAAAGVCLLAFLRLALSNRGGQLAAPPAPYIVDPATEAHRIHDDLLRLNIPCTAHTRVPDDRPWTSIYTQCRDEAPQRRRDLGDLQGVLARLNVSWDLEKRVPELSHKKPLTRECIGWRDALYGHLGSYAGLKGRELDIWESTDPASDPAILKQLIRQANELQRLQMAELNSVNSDENIRLEEQCE